MKQNTKIFLKYSGYFVIVLLYLLLIGGFAFGWTKEEILLSIINIKRVVLFFSGFVVFCLIIYLFEIRKKFIFL
jgi:hypothetical protein